MKIFKKLFNTASKSKEAEPAERNVRYPIPGETSGSPVSVPSPATGSETFYEVDLGAEDVEEKKSVRRQFPSFRPFGWFKERREEKELAERVLLAKGMVAGISANLSHTESLASMGFSDSEYVQSISQGLTKLENGNYKSGDRKFIVHRVTKREFENVIRWLPEILGEDEYESLLIPVLQLVEMQLKTKTKYFVVTRNLDYRTEFLLEYKFSRNGKESAISRRHPNNFRLTETRKFPENEAWDWWDNYRFLEDVSFLAAKERYGFKFVICAAYADDGDHRVWYYIDDWFKDSPSGVSRLGQSRRKLSEKYALWIYNLFNFHLNSVEGPLKMKDFDRIYQRPRKEKSFIQRKLAEMFCCDSRPSSSESI
ncbi:hypothetical protein PVL30_002134 [Lodderomyces elongisporus]|uniref:uncharacterized protein n=1 Tax=Lodderomyces elongisporus TaxID=36914 RepID=UPI0029211D07|nr:uncharacterized protein PVL30_002134 [Lodderomyces elongisporus]WLF78396.1 hypothetical protein PVL30_002134 [Lodderomyces elongisporus]